MRAILIDPKEQTITEVEHNGDFRDIQRQIEARCFDCVRLGDKNQNTIYVDDEGLMNGKVESSGMFRVEGDYPAHLAGKGLILGTDREGDSVATDLSIEDLKQRIAFGKPVRLNGHLVFVELMIGEVPTPLSFAHNRFWAIDN